MLPPILDLKEAEQYLPAWAVPIWDARPKPVPTFKVGDRVLNLLYGSKFQQAGNGYGTITYAKFDPDRTWGGQSISVTYDDGCKAQTVAVYYIHLPKEHDPSLR